MEKKAHLWLCSKQYYKPWLHSQPRICPHTHSSEVFVNDMTRKIDTLVYEHESCRL